MTELTELSLILEPMCFSVMKVFSVLSKMVATSHVWYLKCG